RTLGKRLDDSLVDAEGGRCELTRREDRDMRRISLLPRRWTTPLLTAACVAAACAHPVRSGPGPAVDTTRATARAADLEQRVARLELRVLERDAQIEEVQTRLDDARQEVVRAMAKLQTLATRAEAASGI